ncbi:MAG: 30S ribosomal protein S20 [Waddliaceae bacterium]|nr:30S ribosomal protein S20 [Waddliaceae bacterium]
MATKSDTKKKTKRPTAEKRMIQNQKRREINRRFKSTVRTGVKSFLKAVAAQDASAIQESLNTVYSLMDKAVKRGVFRKNKGSRIKARCAAKAASAR